MKRSKFKVNFNFGALRNVLRGMQLTLKNHTSDLRNLAFDDASHESETAFATFAIDVLG